MKPTVPKQIGNLVDELIKEYNLEKPVASQKACWLWGQIVGEGINRYTVKRIVADGVLHVWISSAPLKNELSYRRATILQAINERLGSNPITEIKIH